MLASHFAQEEALLQLVEDTLDTEIVSRILAEHEELCMLACESCALDSAARLRQFGDLLAEHVRYEERVLFPQIQSHPRIADETEEPY